jgi:hypothetical protein
MKKLLMSLAVKSLASLSQVLHSVGFSAVTRVSGRGETRMTPQCRRSTREMIGKIVHYHTVSTNNPHQLQPLAAIVTFEHHDEKKHVNLALFTESGVAINRTYAPYSEEPEVGCWNFIDQEEIDTDE